MWLGWGGRCLGRKSGLGNCWSVAEKGKPVEDEVLSEKVGEVEMGIVKGEGGDESSSEGGGGIVGVDLRKAE